MKNWHQLLLCSKNSDFLNSIQELIGQLDYSLRLIRSQEEIAALDDSYEPSVFVIDCAKDIEATFESIVKDIRAKYKSIKTCFLYRSDFDFELVDRLQNGIDSIIFQHPLEIDMILDWLFMAAPVDIPPEKIAWDFLTSIRIPDLAVDERLDFDLYYYMAANKKFLLYARKDRKLSAEQLEKFTKHNIKDFYVPKNQISNVQKYFANRLSAIKNDGKLTANEKKNRLRNEAKEVFRSLLGGKSNSPKESRLVLESCKNVALTFIQDTSEHPELFKKLMELTAQGRSNYSHSVNVSIFATLFSIVLGEKNLESASAAGLLHDIGLAVLHKRLDERNVAKLSASELTQLKSHPDSSARLVRERSTLDDEHVLTAIAQHHEYFDGTGYPKGLSGYQISSLARICTIADEFDYLTSCYPNQVAMNPMDALEALANDSRFDTQLAKELKSMFEPPKQIVVSDEHIRELMRDPKVESE